MSAVTRIGTVIVPVSDQDRALEFYVGTLGFEVRIDGAFGDGGRWLEVAPPGAATTLALVPGDAMEVSLATADADADHAALRARGRRRRRGGHAHGRLRAADVHVPRPGRQPLPDGRARLS